MIFNVIIRAILCLLPYGDGRDGVLRFDGIHDVLGIHPISRVYRLKREIFPQYMFVSQGAEVKTENFIIHCQEQLINNGKIDSDGDGAPNPVLQ